MEAGGNMQAALEREVKDLKDKASLLQAERLDLDIQIDALTSAMQNELTSTFPEQVIISLLRISLSSLVTLPSMLLILNMCMTHPLIESVSIMLPIHRDAR
jgi:hypothetical protein